MVLLSKRNVLLVVVELATVKKSIRGLKEGILPKFRRKVIESTVSRYKQDRVMRLGPELSCLEWLMKCGATSVKMSDGTEILSRKQMSLFVNAYGVDLKKKIELPESEVVKKYDFSMRSSPSGNRASDLLYAERWRHAPPVFIDEVDASDSVIANPGFRYFAECRQIKKLKMNSCDYFGDAAIKELAVGRLSRTLIDLEIGINPMMTDASALWIVEMRSLKRLHLFQLPNLIDRKTVIRQLRSSLPKCHVTFPLVDMIGLLHQEQHIPFREKL